MLFRSAVASPTLLAVVDAVVVAVLDAMVAAGWLTGLGVGLGDTGVGATVVAGVAALAIAARRTKAVTVAPVETTCRISQP